jgi:hypothetical protein
VDKRARHRIVNTLIIFVVRPPLVLIGVVVKAIYYLSFGWWLDPKLTRRLHEDLVSDIHKWLGFLFTDYGARIIPNDQEPPALFDFAMVTLSVGDLVFRIFRGRGDVTLRVASSRIPNEFHEFSTLLSAMDSGVKRQGFSHLMDIERILKPHMNELKEAFTAQRFPQIKDELLRIYARDRVITKQWETEINRRLYG